MKRIVVLCALSLLPLARAQVPVVAAFSLAQNQYLPDEKMHLKLTIQNHSGQNLQLGADSDYINFTVTDEHKAAVMPLGTNHVYTEGILTLPNGETATREFNLAPYFDIRKPGTYSVKASISVPQWKETIPVPPVPFTVISGTFLLNMPDLTVGVTHIRNDAPPEVRRFLLEKADTGSGMNLYVRLTDAGGGQTYRLNQIGPFFQYSQPDVKLDRYNVLHILHQTGAQSFGYYTIDTLGLILDRQTWEYTDHRPALRADANGNVGVVGGARRFMASDLPPPDKEPLGSTASPVVFPGSKAK